MVVEKGCGKRVSFDGTMMQALELLWLVERLVSGGSDVEHYVRQQVSHLVQGWNRVTTADPDNPLTQIAPR